MSYENEIKHLMRELKFAKSDYLNARLKSEDALRIHSFKTDVETIEFQIEVFKKAAKVDEYEAKAKAWDKLSVSIRECNKEIELKGGLNAMFRTSKKGQIVQRYIDCFESGEPNAKK